MSYIFIIDTDEYSGNFERDLCGYITGCVGDCEVGQEYADKFFEEMEGTKFIDEELNESIFSTLLQYREDEMCERPVKIWETPGFFNDGLGNEYKDEEWGLPYVLENYQKAASPYPELKNLGPHKYHSYQSVAIFFYDEPSLELINLMKERAEKFLTICKDKFNILGFRLLKEETKLTEIKL